MLDESPKPTETLILSSESVGEGHPDKICDQIADAILDSCLRIDLLAKVAVEVAVESNMVLVLGDITCKLRVDIENVARWTLKEIGYTFPTQDVDSETCEVLDRVQFRHASSQLSDASIEVPFISDLYATLNSAIGDGDQGIVFGYATDETPSLLPFTIDLANSLTRALTTARLNGTLPWLWPHSAVQVAAKYTLDQGALVPHRVTSIVISTQSDGRVTLDELRTALIEKIIERTVPAEFLDSQTQYLVQPCKEVRGVVSGRFAGLNGRKTAADSYGGHSAHGSDSLSGRDFRQLGRSGTYAARWIAKSLVAANLARRCTLQASYAKGKPQPISLSVDAYGTSRFTSTQLVQVVRDNFDLSLASIARDLRLSEPIFYKTAKNGHFTDQNWPWERPRKLLVRKFA